MTPEEAETQFLIADVEMLVLEEKESKKKRTNESQFQQEHKRRKKKSVDDDDGSFDWLFDEANTDDDSDGEFTSRVVEVGHNDDFAPEDNGERSCVDEARRVCNKYQHKAEFDGLPLFELFKVTLKFNNKLCSNNKPFINARLCGEIATLKSRWSPDDPVPINFYRVSSDEEPDFVNLDETTNNNKCTLVPLSGPNIRPPIQQGKHPNLNMGIALKINGEELFENDSGTLSLDPYFDLSDREDGPFIVRDVVGDPNCDRILVGVHYTVYEGAWANVEVKMLKKGVCSFYGVIVARPCVFYTRFRLLTTTTTRRGEVECGGRVKLTRSVVAVPSYASLVFGAELYDDEDRESLICRVKTCFPAKPFGEDVKRFSCNGVETLEVKARVNQQLSNNVESGRVYELQSHVALASKVRLVSCEKPEEGFIKVNVAVFFHWTPFKLVVIAGVYRDSLCHFQGVFSQHIHNAMLLVVSRTKKGKSQIGILNNDGYVSRDEMVHAISQN